MTRRFFILLTVVTLIGTASAQQSQPPQSPQQLPRPPIATKWAAQVNAEAPLPEYPRPQMQREQWLNLNGKWSYAIRPASEAKPEKWDGEIVVPFAAESMLSGVMREVGGANKLWYRRTFTPKAEWTGQRLLLHFGAVDWHTTVWVNGRQVGEHKGGYDPFTFDITEAARSSSSDAEIVVSVWDPTDEGEQPRGKQVRKPRTIWYTAVTGIWQTVWIEPVPERFVERVKITPDPDRNRVRFEVTAGGAGRTSQFDTKAAAPIGIVTVVIKGEGGKVVAKQRGSAGQPFDVTLANATRWSPATPFLYDVEVSLSGVKTADRVNSYFGMRTIEMKADERGHQRMFLNGKPLFQYGPLDQGWWPDGLYTAPTDEALKYDLDVTQQLGFNMIRKHVKVEPARWYYWCDKMGILVWQDMPSPFPKAGNDRKNRITAESAKQFESELTAMIDALSNHPSIVMWVPFNEGWGQYDTPRVAKLVKDKDPTRLVNESSGWDNHNSGDIRDVHDYPGPSMPPLEKARIAVLGEFGGLGLVVDDHIWQADKNWGYRSYKTRQELNDQYTMRVASLRPLIGGGLAAAIYTQTTDVEIEVNGFMTYDRAIVKLDTDRVKPLHESLYAPPARTDTVLPISGGAGAKHAWRYTTVAPAANWFEPAFADGQWQQALGPFGKNNFPISEVNTAWDTPEIWIRRAFTLDRMPASGSTLYLLIRHDQDATVYVNGQKIADVPGNSSHYMPVEADKALRAALKAGSNMIAIHCRQTRGDQFIDAGIISSGVK
jgi:Glycosyl hydrolases family 2, sugar binding domain/Glycosyl hydrolases family 2, TIM barrel domain/Glycosyl hydrolases family 2